MKMAQVPHPPRVCATLIPYSPYQFHYTVISTATDAQNTPGYCWSFYFHVTPLLSLGQIFSTSRAAI